jgi:hypothetical protein
MLQTSCCCVCRSLLCVPLTVVCVPPPQAGQPRSFADLENELLKGQKLQGVLTSDEVQVRANLAQRGGGTVTGASDGGGCSLLS